MSDDPRPELPSRSVVLPVVCARCGWSINVMLCHDGREVPLQCMCDAHEPKEKTDDE